MWRHIKSFSTWKFTLILSQTGLGELKLDLYRERSPSTIQEERKASVTQTDNQSLGVVWHSLSFNNDNEIQFIERKVCHKTPVIMSL